MKHNQNRQITLKIGFLMDPMDRILLDVDTSMSIMMEAEKRGHKTFYIEPHEICCQNGSLFVNARQVSASRKTGFKIIKKERLDLKSLDVIFNRKEPPFNDSYLYLTQLLELIEKDVFIVNSPAGVRKANEKLYILQFKKWIPETFVSKNPEELKQFYQKMKTSLVAKPLDEKGGKGILLIKYPKNPAAIFNRMTQGGRKWVMVQKFIKKVLKEGDKRILILNGQVIGQFAKIPRKGEFRANLSLGAKHVLTKLTQKEKQLINALRPKLVRDGIYFAGIDVLDGKLLEVNVTSPAGLPEIAELMRKRPEALVVDFLEKQVLRRR